MWRFIWGGGGSQNNDTLQNKLNEAQNTIFEMTREAARVEREREAEREGGESAKHSALRKMGLDLNAEKRRTADLTRENDFLKHRMAQRDEEREALLTHTHETTKRQESDKQEMERRFYEREFELKNKIDEMNLMEKRLELFVLRETELIEKHAKDLAHLHKKLQDQEAQNAFLERTLNERARQLAEKEESLADLNNRLLLGRQFEMRLQALEATLNQREDKLRRNEEAFRAQSAKSQSDLDALKETLGRKETDLEAGRLRMVESTEQQRTLLTERQAKLDQREADIAARTTQQLRLLDDMTVKKDTALLKLNIDIETKNEALVRLEAQVASLQEQALRLGGKMSVTSPRPGGVSPSRSRPPTSPPAAAAASSMSPPTPATAIAASPRVASPREPPVMSPRDNGGDLTLDLSKKKPFKFAMKTATDPFGR
jgi:hypothetical protein